MPVPRKRSCAQCRRAKARCSLTAPKCMRCISRHLDCDYSAAGTPGLSSSSWEGAIVGSVQPGADSEQFDMTFLDLEGTAGMQWDAEPFPSCSRNFPRRTPSAFGGRDHSFHFGDRLIQNLDVLNQPWSQQPFAPTLPTAETQQPRIQELQEDISPESYLTELSKMLFMADFPAPPWPSPKTIPLRLHNLLSRRPVETIGSTLTANYLFSIIQSYPEMLSTSQSPPFVHRYFTDLNSDLPVPLANCMSFMPMLRSKTPASEKFVHKTLFLEAQRLHNEFHMFDEWMKLASIQALAIYIILVASEKDCCPTLCAVLVLAIGEILSVLHTRSVVSEKESNGNIDWDEWIFIETKRRTMILLWLLEMLLDMNIGVPASTSCRTLDDIPLPCTKDIWEAATKKEWETKYKSHFSSRKSREMAKIGDLRAAQDSDSNIVERPLADDLHLWSSNADSFGGLIMLIIR